jgi:hypothetical protein
MANKIAGRIRVDLVPEPDEDLDDFNDKVMTVIESNARRLLEGDTVWVEVQYRDRLTGEWEDWDETGDALEFHFTEDAITIRTLTSDEWKKAVA